MNSYSIVLETDEAQNLLKPFERELRVVLSSCADDERIYTELSHQRLSIADT